MRFGGKANVFEGIVDEIRQMIELGVLKRGDKLPSVRSFAIEHKVNPNTVAKAYTVLEEAGYIRVLPKKGAYVEYGAGAKNSREEELERQVLTLKNAGISKEELLGAIEAAYKEADV